MPSDRTTVTELSTALGMLGFTTVEEALREKPAALAALPDHTWQSVVALEREPAFVRDFYAGFANGRAFLHSPDALRGRVPALVEWTGGRRPPGDEVVPADLRVDHVYLVSCKYRSHILHNPSPARLVEGLLSQAPVDDRGDWYERVAADEYAALYQECRRSAGVNALPSSPSELTSDDRRRLAAALKPGWPSSGAAAAYEQLCSAVSEATARRWRERLSAANREEVLWGILRIGSAPYFILGGDEKGPVRLRIATPWDWRQQFRLRHFDVLAQPGGQPRVGWTASYEVRRTGEGREVRGPVEVRWSHGRFGQRPEAKVYLDTRHEQVPGYFAL